MRPQLTAMLAAMAIAGVGGCGGDKDVTAEKGPAGAATTATGAKGAAKGSSGTTTDGPTPAAPSSPATTVPAETPASVDPLPKAEFVRRANGVCRQLGSDLRPILTAAKSEDDLSAVVPKLARAYETALRDMVAVGPPTSLAKRFRAFTRTVARQVAELAQTRPDAAIPAQIERVGDLTRRSDKLARRLGLTACVGVTQRR